MCFLSELKEGKIQLIHGITANGYGVQTGLDLNRLLNPKATDLPPVFQISSGKSAPKSGSS